MEIRKLEVHIYGAYCSFNSTSESYFAGVRTAGEGRGPFNHEVFEGGSKFLGGGARSPLEYFHRTGDFDEAIQAMRARISERAAQAAKRDGLRFDGKTMIEHI